MKPLSHHIRQFYDRWISREEDYSLVKVYSHPRSGTHLMEAFLARNFYRARDLEVRPVEWGHWSKRRVLEQGNPFGRLFGSHVFPRPDLYIPPGPIVYVYRDGRAVAHSIWKTENFLNPALSGISFSEFLRTPLDWIGTPGRRHDLKDMNIAQHWSAHVNGWMGIARESHNVLAVPYEGLLDAPQSAYQAIHSRFFSKEAALEADSIDRVRNPVGLLPNAATKDSWKQVFSESDLRFFEAQVAPIIMTREF